MHFEVDCILRQILLLNCILHNFAFYYCDVEMLFSNICSATNCYRISLLLAVNRSYYSLKTTTTHNTTIQLITVYDKQELYTATTTIIIYLSFQGVTSCWTVTGVEEVEVAVLFANRVEKVHEINVKYFPIWFLSFLDSVWLVVSRITFQSGLLDD